MEKRRPDVQMAHRLARWVAENCLATLQGAPAMRLQDEAERRSPPVVTGVPPIEADSLADCPDGQATCPQGAAEIQSQSQALVENHRQVFLAGVDSLVGHQYEAESRSSAARVNRCRVPPVGVDFPDGQAMPPQGAAGRLGQIVGVLR